MKTKIVMLLVTVFALVLSCGEDATGPETSEVTPSVLSVEFTGDSSKIGTSNSRVSIQIMEDRRLGPKGSCEVTASWTICGDATFNSYVLYRSESSGISIDPSSAEILGVFTDANSTEYIDTNISWAIEYYYALKTNDTNDNSVWSNETSIMTPGTAPTASILSVNNVTYSFVDMQWTQCPDDDFESYKLYRSQIPNIQNDTSFAECIYAVFDASGMVYTDTDVFPNNIFFYALMTTNIKGLASWSNEIEVVIPDDLGIPDSVVATINVGDFPYNICTLPSGSYAYVANYGNDNVSVIRTLDNSVVATIGVGDGPIGICSSPTGDYVYVTNHESNDVSVIHVLSNSMIATINVGLHPEGICVPSSGAYIYVVNSYDDNVSVICTTTYSVVATVNVGDRPGEICSTQSGTCVYVANRDDCSISRILTFDNSVITIGVGDHPGYLCVLPSEEYIYITRPNRADIVIIRTLDNAIVGYIIDVGGPLGICVLPSGEYVYVVNGGYNQKVSIIRTIDNTIIANVELGNYSGGGDICSLPSGDCLYVTRSCFDVISVIQ